jgi:2-succinyl-5-enolpyruvyl-6-hydroxy-3-cyclohexene-1-carboxylate synthase
VTKKYDIGIFGLWYGRNYGSMLTYYALSNVLQDMGCSTAMIYNPLGKQNVDYGTLPNSHPLLLAKEHYELTPYFGISEMPELNSLCDKFVVGADQLWNYDLSRAYQQSYFLDFAADDRLKIAFGTSFGSEHYNGPETDKPIVAHNLSRFSGVSVRDDYSLNIAINEFNIIDAVKVIDPVFLCDAKHYALLSEDSSFKPKGRYILAYILNPNDSIGSSLLEVARTAGVKIYVVLDEQTDQFQENLHALKLGDSSNVEVVKNVGVKEFLWLFNNANFVYTDSFHGVCFSIIYRKQFLVLKNAHRAPMRFKQLLQPIELAERLTENAEVFATFDRNNLIDYDATFSKVEKQSDFSIQWLKTALEKPVKSVPKFVPSVNSNQAEIDKALSNPDTIKCRILVALLRDYHIDHVVISSGARNLTLSRLLENNPQHFKVYHVTDERSAGYFALGLAAKLRRPVGICCTSGTAASNYTPAITEAFYTGVPIIAITGDRYPAHLNQGEDQTIPQSGMFEAVTKKSVTLPVTVGSMAEWETRRLISDAILECTRDGLGPVHIDMPVNKIEMSPPPEEVYILPKVRKISRITRSDSPQNWKRYIDDLRTSKRILVVYGQNPPPSEEQKRNIERFAEKYNCVISADYLSNLFCEHCIHPYNMIRALEAGEFGKTLAPEILISIGGKRIMNDPMTGRIQNGSGAVRHWRVAPDGNVVDFYRRLTSVLECTQDWFFEYFAANAGDIENDNIYYNEWVKRIETTPPVVEMRFNSLYTTGELMSQIPSKSLFHLAVGNTFMFAQRFPLREDVEVFCNMGTNGIDGCTSAFMGQATVASDDEMCFLLVGDLSFFYDMNALWNKKLKKNMRIMLNNDSGAGLLKHYRTKAITQTHGTTAKGWVESLGFTYFSATNKEEFDNLLPKFVAREGTEPIFFEVFVP